MSRPLHALVVSVLVRNQGNKVLLIRHPRRGWEIPQGHVEHGEDLLAAACREVYEESGYEIEIDRLLAVFSKTVPDPSAVIFGFSAQASGGDSVTSDESLEVGWFEEDVAARMPEHPVNRDRLHQLLQSAEGVSCFRYQMSPFIQTLVAKL